MSPQIGNSVDFDSSFVFPSFIAITGSRPDIVIYLVLKKTVILIELTSPCEDIRLETS